MKTQIYEIRRSFAKYNEKGRLPFIFAAVQLKETNKAVYLFGKATIETAKTGRC